ncbi:MAG: amidohydrolase [Steroidobacteraceae bacterium]|nr:amidohydrolase [Steroidobacteraceae bacterium]
MLRTLTAIVGLLLAVSPAIAQPAPAPERIYINARVWTADAAQPAAEAFAVADGRFMAVGSNAVVRALAGPATETIDLGGRRVVPGFIDTHWHLPARRSARLDNAGSVAVIQQRLVEYAQGLPGDGWIVGRGWMPTDFPNRTAHRSYLDTVFPDRPVVLRDRDGHQALANTRALSLAGVTRDSADPPDGRIERDASGEPTGLLKEGAAGLVTGLLPSLSADDTYQLLLEELQAAASFGLTSLTDATDVGLTDNERGAVERALAEDRLTVNYRAALPLEVDTPPERLARYAALRDSTRGQLLSYGFAKGMIDGTVDAKTAVMLEPYVGGGNGTAFLPQDDLNRTVAAYDRAGIQVILHAIGDGAIRMALDSYEHTARLNGPRDSRHRVEHVEVPALADLPRFAKLGVIAATQAIFATPDTATLENYVPNIGPERASRAQPFRKFDDAGVVQAFGSDYPVYPMDPLLGIYTAVTRQTRDGTPAGGWFPENRIDVETALRHYTRDAAYASFDETRTGSISAGKYADFVVLSHDILAAPAQQILDTRVLLTVLRGRETHRASGLARP